MVKNRSLYTALTFLLILSLGFADFELRTLTVDITLKNDLSAHVREKINLFIDSNESISLYEQSIIYNDLSTWINKTGISDLKAHVDQSQVEVRDLKVSPQEMQKCNTLRRTCHAELILDYDIYPITGKENQTGIIDINKYKPRTKRYELRPEAISLPRSKTGDLLLGDNTILRISVPDDAIRISLSKKAENIKNDEDYKTADSTLYYVGDEKSFEWTSKTKTLPQFSLKFEIEDSLEQEIMDFILSIQTKVFTTVLSADGAAYLIVAASFMLSILWLHSLNLK